MNAPTWSSANHRSGSFAPRRLHGKFTRDQVAERIAHMRAFRIGLVELDQRIAMRIGFPRHVLEVLDQMSAVWIHQEPMLAGVINRRDRFATGGRKARYVCASAPIWVG